MLREALGSRLAPAGWTSLTEEDGDPSLAGFLRSDGGDIAATAEVSQANVAPDIPELLVSDMSVGVSYEPLRRLSPLLGQFTLAVLSEEVWPPVRDDDGVVEPFMVRDARSAEGLAADLAAVILEEAPTFASRYGSFDSLLHQCSLDGRRGDLRYAALLAAAGRFDEACTALDTVAPPWDRPAWARQHRRAARQLRRWIESGGNSSLIPASPPPSRFAPYPRVHSADIRAKINARRAAVEEIRRSARGKSREESREMLADALARHGAEQQSPLWIENTLDHLDDSRIEQVQLGFRTLSGLARLGVQAVHAIRNHDVPDVSPPEWLEPPDYALYEFPTTEPCLAVSLDPQSDEWLARAYEAVPKIGGSAHFTVWLEREPRQALQASGLIVHAAERRVGHLSPDDSPTYGEVLKDADVREEHPCLPARLTRRERAPHYLLEIGKPR